MEASQTCGKVINITRSNMTSHATPTKSNNSTVIFFGPEFSSFRGFPFIAILIPSPSNKNSMLDVRRSRLIKMIWGAEDLWEDLVCPPWLPPTSSSNGCCTTRTTAGSAWPTTSSARPCASWQRTSIQSWIGSRHRSCSAFFFFFFGGVSFWM